MRALAPAFGHILNCIGSLIGFLVAPLGCLVRLLVAACRHTLGRFVAFFVRGILVGKLACLE
jgi:hypothetical protein